MDNDSDTRVEEGLLKASKDMYQAEKSSQSNHVETFDDEGSGISHGFEYVDFLHALSRTRNIFDGQNSYLPPKTLILQGLRWPHCLTVSIIAAVTLSAPIVVFFVTNSSAQDYGNPCSPVWSKATGVEAWLKVIPLTPNLSFASVKCIDIAWNIVVGKGGQALMLWICYRVYRACLVRLMETTGVPYSLFTSLAFGAPTIPSLKDMVKFQWGQRRAWEHRILMLWLISSLIWIACWSPMTDAMTSYAPSGDGYKRLVDGSFESLDVFAEAELAFGAHPSYDSHCLDFPLIVQRDRPLDVQHSMSSFSNVTNDPVSYQLLVKKFREALHLEQGQLPSLNALSKFYKSKHGGYLHFESLPAELSHLFANCSKLGKPSFDIYHIVQDVPYHEGYVFGVEPTSLVCGSQSEVYQWGYSLLVIYFMSFHGLWVLGTYITWLHTQRLRNGRLNRCGRGFGPYRAMVDLTGAIHEELGSTISGYSDKEIEKELARRAPVRYVMRQAGETYNTDSGKEELMWRLALSSREGDRELDLHDRVLIA